MASKRHKKPLRIALALALAAAGMAGGFFAGAVAPAQAQFFERYPFFDLRPRQPRYYEPQEERPVDYSRAPAPAPRKSEVQPTNKILVFGDSTADWLAYGLEDALADNPETVVVRKHRAFSGLIRYEARNDAPDWAQVAREAIAAERPNIVIMMIGVQDRQTIREKEQPQKPGTDPQKQADAKKQGAQTPAQNQDSEQTPVIAGPELQSAKTGSYEFRSEKWEELYIQKIDATIEALKTSGVPVLWVGLPSIRGTRSTSEATYLDELYRNRAEKAGIIYVDVWDGFVDENGRFVTSGPDVEGQVRRLRTPDGVHFTKAGARKLAHFIERELDRGLLDRSVAPVSLSTPTEPATPASPSAPKTGPAARPLAGPVLMLTAPAEEGGELLGGNTRTPAADPLAAKVLVNGEPTSAEAGRADDFSWPPRLPNTKITEPLPPTGAPVVASTAPASTPGKPANTGPSAARVAGQPVLQGEARPQPRGPRQAQSPYPYSPYYRPYPPAYYRPNTGGGLFGLFRW